MKTCPHCGAQIGDTAKFCSECGYNVGGGVVPVKAQSKDFWIKLVPNILFLVFAVLLFGVYALSVINGLISANVYSLCDSTVINDTAISVVSILLVVFAVFTLIAAVATAAVKYVAYKDGRPVNCQTDWVSFGCYILYFILGLIMLVVVASTEHVLMGACPIWLIVLPIIFTCLLGAFKAYIKYNATAPAAAFVKPITDSAPSNQDVEQAENKKEKVVKEKANRKKRATILPEVFLLLFAVIMGGLYFVPSIMYYYRTYYVNHLSLVDYDFGHIGSGMKLVINLFQIVYLLLLVAVVITAIVLLVKGCQRNSSDNPEKTKKSKTLLISLIMQIIYVVLACGLMLFAMMAMEMWTDIGSIFLFGFPLLCAIGTIIAMAVSKKKRNKEAANNLE
ncbi:MAG: zinc ribbon domain-containing protein [Clostridiales bacterium]|nr:zinc ribbon domain-containing protein [Clostridiales bacterium]